MTDPDRPQHASLRRALHQALDAVDRSPVGTWLRVRRWSEAAWIRTLDAAVALQSDRVYLRRVLLPVFVHRAPTRVLFVGVRRYTRDCAVPFRTAGIEYWTTDIDPEAARWGEPGRHRTCDATRLDHAFEPEWFDLVVINGVFGWGLDGPENIARALSGARRILRPGGLLLLGWNAGRIDEPAMLAALGDGFRPEHNLGVPQRRAFADVTHIYALYRAN